MTDDEIAQLTDADFRPTAEEGHGVNSFLAGLLFGELSRIKSDHGPLAIMALDAPVTQDDGATWFLRVRTTSGHVLEVKISYVETMETLEQPAQ